MSLMDTKNRVTPALPPSEELGALRGIADDRKLNSESEGTGQSPETVLSNGEQPPVAQTWHQPSYQEPRGLWALGDPMLVMPDLGWGLPRVS